ncbi:hypothetical protein SLEP1_g47073 [Rubroshorea leprosula]|uniref:BHLH domain-containing protein n=1 Tax=Rubroshorea leprosula TaxID=152421 RepID=A0AAV5LQ51_9ROSI|nr:hypothetical protein SLEP1_g47073 [Rubroshorea leprosula]
MRTGKRNQEEGEFEEEKQGPFSNVTTVSDNANRADGKNSDKANAIRSKHSVTEQRRRSKINERFLILRELVPSTDQKRDTASFLLEVIEYVQYLQEKVQKYEGSYPGWNPEPTKLMPWRNSHWRSQSFAGNLQAVKDDCGPGSMFPGKFDENNISITPAMFTGSQNPLDCEPNQDVTSKVVDQQPELANKGMPPPMPASIQGDGMLMQPLQRPVSDAHLIDSPLLSDTMNQEEELAIEGGTISISSIYSQGLLNSLTQALQSAGMDLSHAKVSVQIDLGKRANRGLTPGTSASQDPQNSQHQAMTHLRDVSTGEDLDQAQKRIKK